jgi:UDP-glucose 4-epimerase
VILILVTGGAGFIGSRLCGRLAAAGHRVVSVDNYFVGSRRAHVAGVEYRSGATAQVRELREDPTWIFHLGEYARVAPSFDEPELVYELNVAGTAGVLELWRRTRAKLIYAGSSTRFGDAASPYEATKRANAELIRATGECLGLRYAIGYLCNAYGPGERAGRYGTLIETWRRQRLRGEPLTVRLPGTQRRNFTHVDDIVDGLVALAERGRGDGYVLGGQASYSLCEVAQMFGGPVAFVAGVRGDRSDAPLDFTAVRQLGWIDRRYLSDYIAGVASAA